jgi:hypothetical protein
LETEAKGDTADKEGEFEIDRQKDRKTEPDE